MSVREELDKQVHGLINNLKKNPLPVVPSIKSEVELHDMSEYLKNDNGESTTDGMKKVFIGYCSNDRPIVNHLANLMLRKRGLTPIVVESQKGSMESIAEKTKRNLDEADFFVPVLTHNSIKAQWINQEIGYALARNIKMFPLVEANVIKKLKGFIHNQNDLPFNFRAIDQSASLNSEFDKCCQNLINAIIGPKLKKPKKPKKAIGLSDIFEGRWMNHYEFPHGRFGDELFEIKKNTEYYINQEKFFDLDQIQISKDQKNVVFRKVGCKPGDSRNVLCELMLISPGVYEGNELDNKVRLTKIY